MSVLLLPDRPLIIPKSVDVHTVCFEGASVRDVPSLRDHEKIELTWDNTELITFLGSSLSYVLYIDPADNVHEIIDSDKKEELIEHDFPQTTFFSRKLYEYWKVRLGTILPVINAANLEEIRPGAESIELTTYDEEAREELRVMNCLSAALITYSNYPEGTHLEDRTKGPMRKERFLTSSYKGMLDKAFDAGLPISKLPTPAIDPEFLAWLSGGSDDMAQAA